MAHSDKKVIFKRPDGTIAILMPVDSCPLTFDEIIAKDIPNGYKQGFLIGLKLYRKWREHNGKDK